MPTTNRITYIDWLRGLACLLMFQGHAYDSWLSPQARQTALFGWSRLLTTLPAPLFIFLSGISLALVSENLRRKGATRKEIFRKTFVRGAGIFGLGLLFRVQEFVFGYPAAPWTDLFRVDVLNMMGLSIMFSSLLYLATSRDLETEAASQTRGAQWRTIGTAVAAAALISLATPLLWTSHRLSWLPWQLQSYINGVHIFGEPQPWLFPIFPWSAFAFAGLAVGMFLFSRFAKGKEVAVGAGLGLLGIVIAVVALLFEYSRFRFYAADDFWHTSPNFFLIRCGIVLLILSAAFFWTRRSWAQDRFSPLSQLGKTSLLVYWVHMELVYGRLSILPRGQCGVWKASAGLIAIFVLMLTLSVLRTKWKETAAGAKGVTPHRATAAAPAESL
jgi:uncharacterized membrane protein